jgi:hypothetical protein
MPAIQNSELIKVVGIATGFATLCVEYQIIEHYVRRYEETVEKRKSGTLPASMLSLMDGMKVTHRTPTPSTIVDGTFFADPCNQVKEYERCKKMLQGMAEGLSHYGYTVDPERRDQGRLLPDLRYDQYKPQALRGYDPNDYEPPENIVVTPKSKKRKRVKQNESRDDDDDSVFGSDPDASDSDSDDSNTPATPTPKKQKKKASKVTKKGPSQVGSSRGRLRKK